MVSAETHALDVTPDQAVTQLERNLGLSDDELAGALNTSSRTIHRWRTGDTYPQHHARVRLAELIELDRRLRETFEGVAAARLWLHAENRYLGGLTPADAIRVGRIDRVYAALEALDSGIFL